MLRMISVSELMDVILNQDFKKYNGPSKISLEFVVKIAVSLAGQAFYQDFVLEILVQIENLVNRYDYS